VFVELLIIIIKQIYNVCIAGVEMLTRSQAVARIADRTAKNCMGHVT